MLYFFLQIFVKSCKTVTRVYCCYDHVCWSQLLWRWLILLFSCSVFRMLEALRYVFAWLFIVLRTTGKFIWLMLRAACFPSQREELGEGSENPFSWRHLKYHLEKHLLSLHKKAFLGKRAVNCRLLSADGETTYQLLDFMKDSRPLVLNFGSSTWDLFVEALPEFNKIVHDFADVADFLIIYTAEAHPTEGWRIKASDIPCTISWR